MNFLFALLAARIAAIAIAAPIATMSTDNTCNNYTGHKGGCIFPNDDLERRTPEPNCLSCETNDQGVTLCCGEPVYGGPYKRDPAEIKKRDSKPESIASPEPHCDSCSVNAQGVTMCCGKPVSRRSDLTSIGETSKADARYDSDSDIAQEGLKRGPLVMSGV